MCRFWAGGISSFPFSRAREYRLLRRLGDTQNGDFVVHCFKVKIYLLLKRRKGVLSKLLTREMVV
jgi:hypothetical protein